MKVIPAARPPTLARRIEIWLDGLRYRPALWLAPAIVLGCVFGAHLAAWLTRATPNPTRDSLFLLYPVPLSALAAFLWWRWRKYDGFLSRLALFVAVVLALSTLSARRVLPPPHDVSELAQAATKRPNQRVPVVLQGWVAAIPRRGDFGVEFPLECARADLAEYSGSPLPYRNGKVWTRAPLDVDVAVGDAVTVQAELAELPAAGNRGERSRRPRYLLKDCWSIGTVRDKDNIKLVRSSDRYPHARMVAGVRKYLLENYEQNFAESGRLYPALTAQLLTAMVFGEGGLREPLPRQVRDDFRAAGLSHILVASGAQAP